MGKTALRKLIIPRAAAANRDSCFAFDSLRAFDI
jgi:hypothetical protein